ncbi:hypothetical protein ACM66B_006022 [Microbotryomycetes sp. NB124-2]
MSLPPSSHTVPPSQTVQQALLCAQAEVWAKLFFSHRVDWAWDQDVAHDEERARQNLYPRNTASIVQAACHRTYNRFQTELAEAQDLLRKLAQVNTVKVLQSNLTHYYSYDQYRPTTIVTVVNALTVEAALLELQQLYEGIQKTPDSECVQGAIDLLEVSFAFAPGRMAVDGLWACVFAGNAPFHKALTAIALDAHKQQDRITLARAHKIMALIPHVNDSVSSSLDVFSFCG